MATRIGLLSVANRILFYIKYIFNICQLNKILFLMGLTQNPCHSERSEESP